jgi:glycine betaine/proline transport system substrate-binding protein
VKYKGEWVAFPKYTKACYEDPAWGTNPNEKYDCSKPRGPIWKVAWSGVKDKWPGAYRAIKAFNVNNDEMGAMVADVDLNGKKLEDVVAAWMGANESRWSAWIK